MGTNEIEVINFMRSIKEKYFPELQISSFEVMFDQSFEGVMGRALFGKSPKVVLHYSDNRILEPNYRAGLIPIVVHELAHFIDPVNPERIMRERLPAPMMTLWDELLRSREAECSFSSQQEKEIE